LVVVVVMVMMVVVMVVVGDKDQLSTIAAQLPTPSSQRLTPNARRQTPEISCVSGVAWYRGDEHGHDSPGHLDVGLRKCGKVKVVVLKSNGYGVREEWVWWYLVCLRGGQVVVLQHLEC
jgi:hypothetical protein